MFDGARNGILINKKGNMGIIQTDKSAVTIIWHFAGASLTYSTYREYQTTDTWH
jgi:hypothetical protein